MKSTIINQFASVGGIKAAALCNLDATLITVSLNVRGLAFVMLGVDGVLWVRKR